jgi:CRISP-associated protein Cas1
MMSTLYVVEQGARIEKTYHSLEVTLDDEVLLRAPLARVSDVVLVGNVGLTTPAMQVLLEAGIPVALLRQSGELLGRLTPLTPRNLDLRRRQYQRAADPDFALAISRQIVHGKLDNQRTLARRICRNYPEIDAAPLDDLKELLEKVESAADLASLKGFEGNGAKIYFAVLRAAIGAGWGFTRRARRPPPDPINALLSLGYSLLCQNAITALEIAGLDPYDGFYHADQYARPALALDLMEEFRCVIVDSVVLNVVSREMIRPEDFLPGRAGGVFLKQPALKDYLRQYTARLQSQVRPPDSPRRLSYQKCLELQARKLRHVIEGESERYLPLRVR